MTPQEERFFKHAITNDPLAAWFLENQFMHGQSVMRHAANSYICPRCEAIALVHMGDVLCGRCGTFVPKEKTHKLKQHIEGGFFR